MKLSLAWIFDHIEADWKDQDIDLIAAKFNAIVAEIEHVSRFKVDLSSFYLARQESTSGDEVVLYIPELSQTVTLPKRAGDLVSAAHPVYMIKKASSLGMPLRGFSKGERLGDDSEAGRSLPTEPFFGWASLSDFSEDKEGLLPALDADEYALSGNWRSVFEEEDIILEVDNKSLNHRPDMWGHRGFAREIAAYLDLPFIHDADFLQKRPVMYVPNISSETATTPIIIENKAEAACSRFAGLYVKSIENKPSNIKIASRLLRVGQRPINLLVDLSNYIACDWSQPVHVYDADKIEDSRVVVRMAHPGEKLDLLDGQTITLTTSDLVIADAKKPMCLAGIKGGIFSSVSAQTNSIFFEAAHFDAGTVRRSSVHHKLRTDSSARFEKTLDPNQAVDAVFRFAKLLEECGISATIADEIIAVGVPPIKEQVIEVSHQFLEKQIGVTLSEEDIIKPLSKLGFKVLETHIIDHVERVYLIGVPTYRGSKDVKIKEDILEEVARCYGFEKIPHVLPPIFRPPYDMQAMMRERKIKQFLAYSSKMVEFQNYAFFDEENLVTLGLHTIEAQALLNPVSENYSRLATSLIPALMKNIRENQVQQESLPIFEWGKIWPYRDGKTIEQYCLAGIFFERRKSVDFYACKAELEGLLRFLSIEEASGEVQEGTACNRNFECIKNTPKAFPLGQPPKKNRVDWQKVEHAPAPWYNPYQTAKITYGEHILGYAGIIDQSILSKIDALPESTAFVFELNGDLLRSLAPLQNRYESISRYQDTYFDVSLMVPITRTVAEFLNKFGEVSPLIKKIELLDFFEKKEWTEQRSLTFRLWLSHPDKTLEKQEIDAVWEAVVGVATGLGAQLRAGEQS